MDKVQISRLKRCCNFRYMDFRQTCAGTAFCIWLCKGGLTFPRAISVTQGANEAASRSESYETEQMEEERKNTFFFSVCVSSAVIVANNNHYSFMHGSAMIMTSKVQLLGKDVSSAPRTTSAQCLHFTFHAHRRHQKPSCERRCAMFITGTRRGERVLSPDISINSSAQPKIEKPCLNFIKLISPPPIKTKKPNNKTKNLHSPVSARCK